MAPPAWTELLGTLRARDYRPGPLGTLEGLRTETLRGLLQRAYRRVFDASFDRQHRTLKLTQRARGLFRVSRRPYDGPVLTAADGTRFPPGAAATELHIHSKRLVALAERSALTGLRAVQGSLYDVAALLTGNPEYHEVQVVYALTIFGEVLTPLGFPRSAAGRSAHRPRHGLLHEPAAGAVRCEEHRQPGDPAADRLDDPSGAAGALHPPGQASQEGGRGSAVSRRA